MEVRPKFSSFYFYFYFAASLLLLVWIFPFMYAAANDRIDLVLYSPLFWSIIIVDILLMVIPLFDYPFRKYEIAGNKISSSGLWGNFRIEFDQIRDVDIVETLPDILFSTKSIKINDKFLIPCIKKAHSVMEVIVGG